MRVIRFALVFAVLTAPGQAQQAPGFEDASCPFTVDGDVREQVRCGYLIVRENRSVPDGGTIRLAVAIIKSLSPTPKTDPIVWLVGGPGSSNLSSAPAFAKGAPRFQAARAERDVIFIDQRGTGYSEPRFCPDVAFAFFPAPGMGARERRDRMRAELAACREYMVAAGVDLSSYNSIATTHDLEDLRRTLGYSSLNLYGHSYGTRVALEALRSVPATVRTVILDAPFPPNFSPLPVTFYDALSRLLAACAGDSACAAVYPDAQQSFLATVEELEREPISLQIPGPDDRPQSVSLDGYTFTNMIFGSLYDRRLLPMVPLLIREVRRRNEPVAAAALAFLVRTRLGGRSMGLNKAVMCFEVAPFNDAQKRAREMNDLPPLLHKLDWDTQWWPDPDICGAYHQFRAPAEQAQPVTSATPGLVVTGEFDPASHRSYGPLIAQGLSAAHVVEIPGGGHNDGRQQQCAWGIILRFIDEPTQKLDRRCLATIPKWRFATDVNAILAILGR